MEEINVAFTSTGYGPYWAPAVSSWLQLVGYTSRHFALTQLGKLGGAGVTDRTYTHSAENTLVQNFLEADPKFTHLFMTECDMVLPPDAIVKLLEMDVDMASGIYFLRSNMREGVGQPCLYKRPAAHDPLHSAYGHCAVSVFPTDEPFRIDCAGLGCILIKRRVFEGMEFPWFDLKEKGYGSDMFFAVNAKKAGFELWANPKVMCGQVDYYEMTVADWKWQMDNNPTFAKYGFIIGSSEIGNTQPY